MQVVAEYLRAFDHDPALAARLFLAAAERVVFVVSREEGAFCFEVQPMQEYFAALHLYKTTPHSREGRRGTVDDRVDALFQNPYWLNVTRFYAGHFDVGQLPFLVERLQALDQQPAYWRVSQAPLLAARFLADGVFEQSPKAAKEAAAVICRAMAERRLLSDQFGRWEVETVIALPGQVGGHALVAQGFDLLRRQPPDDAARELCYLLRSNGTVESLRSHWRAAAFSDGMDASAWISYAEYLGISALLSAEDLTRLLDGGKLRAEQVGWLLYQRQGDWLIAEQERYTLAVQWLLDGENEGDSELDRTPSSALEWLYGLADPSLYDRLRSGRAWGDDRLQAFSPSPRFFRQAPADLQGVATAVRGLSLPDWEAWEKDPAPWNDLVESLRQACGERWLCWMIAAFAAEGPAGRSASGPPVDLFDSTQPLCQRVACAYQQADTPDWWRQQLTLAETAGERAIWAWLLTAWGSLSSLATLATELAPLLL